MANDTKGTRGEARLEKAAREGSRSGVPEYEVAAQAVREKMARLKALRLARDAAQPSVTTKSTSKGAKSARAAPKGKPGSKSSVPLSEWLDDQKGSGRRS